MYEFSNYTFRNEIRLNAELNRDCNFCRRHDDEFHWRSASSYKSERVGIFAYVKLSRRMKT